MIMKGILGTKGSTEQLFTEDGDRIPVTQIHTSPCYVVGMKSMDTDGYWAVQLGFKPAKNIKKSKEGLLKKAGIKTPLRFLREVRFDEAEVIEDGKKKGLKVKDLELWIGQELVPSALFSKGELVTVTGTSKGKGFQGVVKRHGFKGGPKTHGQSDRERAPGSIGMSATPGRVYKGKKMAGRMGSDTVTVQNLEVIDVTETSLFVKGLLPGAKDGLIIVRSHDSAPKKQEEPEEAPVEEVKEEVVEQPAEKPVEEKEAPKEKPEAKEEDIKNDVKEEK